MPKNGKTTLAQLLAGEYVPQRLTGRSPATVAAHEIAIGYLEKHLERGAVLADLTDEGLAGFAQSLIKTNAAATVNKQLRHLLALWRFAHRLHLVEKVPLLRLLPEPKRMPTAWSIEQMGSLLAAAAVETRPIAGSKIPPGLWWSALILTIYDTGARISAAMQLPLGAVEWSTAELSIAAETQKQKADQRFHLSDQTMNALLAIRSPARPELFPWGCDPGDGWPSLNRGLKRILTRAGLPSTSHDYWHRIRRTTATHLMEATNSIAAAQEHLGHSAASVTRAYIDPTKLSSRRGAEMLPRPDFEVKTNGKPAAVETAEPPAVQAQCRTGKASAKPGRRARWRVKPKRKRTHAT